MSSFPEISLQDVLQAKEKIQPHIRVTPLEFSADLSKILHSPIYLKFENWQKTGSFKVRGALNKILSLTPEQQQTGVITASAGNHGLGVAYAAQLLQIPAKIVVPENASLAKVRALSHFNIELIKKGRDYDEAEEVAWELQKRQRLTFVHAFDDPEIIAGQGTIAPEILEALPETKTIVVPVGGGGLISGVALAAKTINPEIRVVGVQPDASPAMVNSIQAGNVVETPIGETVADGLAGRFVSQLTLSLTQKYVDEIVVVSENAIHKAVKLILEAEHTMIEASAAVGIAAVLQNEIKLSNKAVFLLTGRNLDLRLLKEILNQD